MRTGVKLRSIKQADLKNKRVLLRVDFNVTQNYDYSIADDTRIKKALPTINYLLKCNSKIVLMAHLGRPNGKIDEKYSLKKVAKRLEKYLGTPVTLLANFWELGVLTKVNSLSESSIVMLENIRFHPGEEQNDPKFSQILARFGEVFVNDAFGVSHRIHASTVGVSAYLPTYAGLLLIKEIETIHRVVTKPNSPFLVIIGGDKTQEKIRVINKLLDVADTIYLGGTVANTFFAALGVNIGISKVDHQMVEMARTIILKIKHAQARLILPRDVVVSKSYKSTRSYILPCEKISHDLGIFDIGPASLRDIFHLVKKAKTIIWNGPMGLYEDPRFAKGTQQTLSYISKSDAETVIGGGDTISTIKISNFSRISHISTGGGAMLDYIEKGTLPILQALKIT